MYIYKCSVRFVSIVKNRQCRQMDYTSRHGMLLCCIMLSRTSRKFPVQDVHKILRRQNSPARLTLTRSASSIILPVLPAGSENQMRCKHTKPHFTAFQFYPWLAIQGSQRYSVALVEYTAILEESIGMPAVF